MDAEITLLEKQLEQLILLYESGRAESRELRVRLARVEADNRTLAEKLKFATEHLESMLDKLPEV